MTNKHDDLSSTVGIDYRKLRDLLKAGKWLAADQETLTVMLKAASREKEGWLDVPSINNLPCVDLRTIDQLWVKSSSGRFGFSIQNCIWQSIGGKPNADFETCYRFGEHVGWRVNTNWLRYHSLTFSLNALPGQFPAAFELDSCNLFLGMFIWEEIVALFSRIETCKL